MWHRSCLSYAVGPVDRLHLRCGVPPSATPLGRKERQHASYATIAADASTRSAQLNLAQHLRKASAQWGAENPVREH